MLERRVQCHIITTKLEAERYTQRYVWVDYHDYKGKKWRELYFHRAGFCSMNDEKRGVPYFHGSQAL